jgi:hypothetical protein
MPEMVRIPCTTVKYSHRQVEASFPKSMENKRDLTAYDIKFHRYSFRILNVKEVDSWIKILLLYERLTFNLSTSYEYFA